jgi:HD-like signal output (HDOD) protein
MGKQKPARGHGNQKLVTIDLVLNRIRRSGDFPTFSKYLIEINQILASESTETTASELANIILKDYALTNKLLKLVNSAFHAVVSGRVTTVTRAVILLGQERVRMAAVGLMLFKHLQGKGAVAELKEVAIQSLWSGLVAEEITNAMGRSDTEEAFICSMLHRLGRSLVLYYLPKEYIAIKEKMQTETCSESKAARMVLDTSYQKIGIKVAREWKFPENIVQSMRRLPRGDRDLKASQDTVHQGIANFTAELCHIFEAPSDIGWGEALTALLERYPQTAPLAPKDLGLILAETRKKAIQHAEVLDIDLSNSRFFRSLCRFMDGKKKADPVREDMPGGLLRRPGYTRTTGLACGAELSQHSTQSGDSGYQTSRTIIGSYGRWRGSQPRRFWMPSSASCSALPVMSSASTI